MHPRWKRPCDGTRKAFARIPGDHFMASSETYIKVKGVWKYLYRAVDSHGKTIDFYLSHTRNSKATKRFLQKTFKRLKPWQQPTKINTDQNSAYGVAIRKMKDEGTCAEKLIHRKRKYLNNVIEADHGKLKRLVKPTLGFTSMKTAYATLKGLEVIARRTVRMFRKGQWLGHPIELWCGFHPHGVDRKVRLLVAATREKSVSLSGNSIPILFSGAEALGCYFATTLIFATEPENHDIWLIIDT